MDTPGGFKGFTGHLVTRDTLGLNPVISVVGLLVGTDYEVYGGTMVTPETILRDDKGGDNLCWSSIRKGDPISVCYSVM